MKPSRTVLLFAAVLSACAPHGAIEPADAQVGAIARLRAQAEVVLEDAEPGWKTLSVTGRDKGAEANPDSAFSAGADVDLNGDGRPERIREQRSTVVSQIYTIYASDAPGAPVLLSGEANLLLVSTLREVNGWPVLGLESRDYDDGQSVEARIIRSYVWTGARYEPAEVYRRAR